LSASSRGYALIPKSEVMGYFRQNNQFRWMWWKPFVDLKEAEMMVNLAQKKLKKD
jgi:hypothetical protein